MRNVIVVLVLMTGALLVALIFQQVVVEGSFGPAAMFASSALGTLFLSLLATLMLSRTRHRELLGRLWLAVFSGAIAYVAVDLIAGWLFIQPLSPPLVPDQYRHHRLVPNSHSEFRQQDFSYIQRVNNIGLRGPDVKVEKPANTYRIVMLGDSFTMGKGVEDDQTFSALLQRSLRDRSDACNGRSVEVLNAGVDSYAPVLSLIQLKREILPLAPDMVVLNLDVSDLVQETAYRQQAVYRQDGEVVAVPQLSSGDSIYERLRDWTGRNLFFTRVLLFHVNRLFGHRRLTVRTVVAEADPATVAHTLEGDVDRQVQWQSVFDSIGRMKYYSDQQGVELLLSVYPWAHQISETEWIPGRYAFVPEGARTSDKSLNTIKEMAAIESVPLLDLFPAFRSYKGEVPLYFRHDMHWTTAGHELVARRFEEYFAQTHPTVLCKSP